MIFTLALAIALFGATSAVAHQPVPLTKQDSSANAGPLLPDGTISYALPVSFAKAGEVRGFRAQFSAGDRLAIQYLVIDKSAESKLKTSQLPTFSILSPTGARTTLRLNLRTKFYEPYSKKSYLYLSKYLSTAESGIYSFTMTSKRKASITVAIGEREVPGQVIRGTVAIPTQTPTANPTASATPTPSATLSAEATPSSSPTPAGITIQDVAKNNSASRCWTVIEGNVYDLTNWIGSHPGGTGAIRSLCGIDGSASFAAQHEGQIKPVTRLNSFLLGPLVK